MNHYAQKFILCDQIGIFYCDLFKLSDLRQTAAKSTHRPSKTERQYNPGFFALDDLQRKGIPPDDRRRSSAEAAGPRRRNLGLVFLQADFEVSIALIPGASAVRRPPGAGTAQAILQLPFHVLH